MNDPRVSHILDIVAKETFVDRVKLVPEATVDELGIASLDLVQTIFAIETQYDVQIPVAGLGGGLDFSTVGSLLDHVIVVLDKVEAARASQPKTPG